MSEFDNPFGEFDEGEAENEDFDSDEGFESDPSTIAFLDQAGAEFQDQRQQFEAMYGFDHDCRCAQDYAEGKLAQVTECYLTLTDDSLETCARLNWENATLQGMVQTMVQMNDDLMKILEDNDVVVNPDEILAGALAATADGPDPESIENEEEQNGETPELS